MFLLRKGGLRTGTSKRKFSIEITIHALEDFDENVTSSPNSTTATATTNSNANPILSSSPGRGAPTNSSADSKKQKSNSLADALIDLLELKYSIVWRRGKKRGETPIRGIASRLPVADAVAAASAILRSPSPDIGPKSPMSVNESDDFTVSSDGKESSDFDAEEEIPADEYLNDDEDSDLPRSGLEDGAMDQENQDSEGQDDDYITNVDSRKLHFQQQQQRRFESLPMRIHNKNARPPSPSRVLAPNFWTPPRRNPAISDLSSSPSSASSSSPPPASATISRQLRRPNSVSTGNRMGGNKVESSQQQQQQQLRQSRLRRNSSQLIYAVDFEERFNVDCTMFVEPDVSGTRPVMREKPMQFFIREHKEKSTAAPKSVACVTVNLADFVRLQGFSPPSTPNDGPLPPARTVHSKVAIFPLSMGERIANLRITISSVLNKVVESATAPTRSPSAHSAERSKFSGYIMVTENSQDPSPAQSTISTQKPTLSIPTVPASPCPSTSPSAASPLLSSQNVTSFAQQYPTHQPRSQQSSTDKSYSARSTASSDVAELEKQLTDLKAKLKVVSEENQRLREASAMAQSQAVATLLTDTAALDDLLSGFVKLQDQERDLMKRLTSCESSITQNSSSNNAKTTNTVTPSTATRERSSQSEDPYSFDGSPEEHAQKLSEESKELRKLLNQHDVELQNLKTQARELLYSIGRPIEDWMELDGDENRSDDLAATESEEGGRKISEQVLATALEEIERIFNKQDAMQDQINDLSNRNDVVETRLSHIRSEISSVAAQQQQQQEATQSLSARREEPPAAVLPEVGVIPQQVERVPQQDAATQTAEESEPTLQVAAEIEDPDVDQGPTQELLDSIVTRHNEEMEMKNKELSQLKQQLFGQQTEIQELHETRSRMEKEVQAAKAEASKQASLRVAAGTSSPGPSSVKRVSSPAVEQQNQTPDSPLTARNKQLIVEALKRENLLLVSENSKLKKETDVSRRHNVALTSRVSKNRQNVHAIIAAFERSLPAGGQYRQLFDGVMEELRASGILEEPDIVVPSTPRAS